MRFVGGAGSDPDRGRADVRSIPKEHLSPRGVRIEPHRVAPRARDAARQGQRIGLVVDRRDADMVRDRRDRNAVGGDAWDAIAILKEACVVDNERRARTESSLVATFVRYVPALTAGEPACKSKSLAGLTNFGLA